MYKVFIQNEVLFFIKSKKSDEFEGIFISDKFAQTNKRFIMNLLQSSFGQFEGKKSKSVPLYIFSENPEESFHSFFSDFDQIEAAGGIVKRKDKYLFIKRNGVWDIPKGKMEQGEKPKETALREIEEECGVLANKVGKLILETYHVFDYKGRHTIKKTYWYAMKFNGSKEVKGQKEEGISRVVWKSKNQLEKIKNNTYLSILEVLNTYFGT